MENYWFRRHEVVYQRLAGRCAGRDVLEAGCGEGYGADLIAGVARRVIGLDYDESAVAHVRARYPRVEVQQGNLARVAAARRVGRCGGELPGHRASVGSGTVRRRVRAGAAAGGAAADVDAQPDHLLPRPRHPDQSVPHPRTQRRRADRAAGRRGLRGWTSMSGRVPRPAAARTGRAVTAARSSTPRSPARWPTRRGPTICWPTSPRVHHRRLRASSTPRDTPTSMTASTWSPSRCARDADQSPARCHPRAVHPRPAHPPAVAGPPRPLAGRRGVALPVVVGGLPAADAGAAHAGRRRPHAAWSRWA